MKALKRLATMVAVGLACLALPKDVAAQSSSTRAHEPIKEEMFVAIGGIEQWITIKGADRNNPVVLFLHGGPGDAQSPFADAMYSGWDKDFTLAQWDQRGAGRTYGKTGPSIAPTMTMARMTQDGVEVAAFLTRHLGKKKVILVGGSWGSILGIHMVHAKPDLFYAYVGLAQVANFKKSVATSYARVLALAHATHDRQAVAALMTIGAPPWDALSCWGKFRKWEQAYQAKLATAPSAPDAINPAYASTQERAQWAAADDFNWMHFVGLKMSGPLMDVDIAELGTDFAIPIFIIQGQEDLTAPPELAKAYFNSIKAPKKQFYLVRGTGHEPSATSLNLTRKVLLEQVRPLAVTVR
jgi:pimeloyl-ACP methyl ester carboxylesterase